MVIEQESPVKIGVAKGDDCDVHGDNGYLWKEMIMFYRFLSSWLV